jgi:hypothetical protein
MHPSQKQYPLPTALYADLREKWKHEDALINQRVTWLLTSQAFLFTAYGVIAGLKIAHDARVGQAASDHIWKALSPYSIAELLVVVSASVVMYFLAKGILAAIQAMKMLKRQLRNHKRNGRIWLRASIDVLHDTTDAGASPSKWMAITFVAVWGIVGAYEFARVVLPFIWPNLPIM